MIAFIKQDDPPRLPPALRRARRLVASTLLRGAQKNDGVGPRVPAWLAWTFTLWIATATVAYGLFMLGWL